MLTVTCLALALAWVLMARAVTRPARRGDRTGGGRFVYGGLCITESLRLLNDNRCSATDPTCCEQSRPAVVIQQSQALP